MAPFAQGKLAHSFTSVQHVPTGTSAYPAAQAHEYAPILCVQVAPFRHGDDAHSSASASQLMPAYPKAQVHVYTNDPCCEHVAPFTHGELSHGKRSVSHLAPVYRQGQWQYPCAPCPMLDDAAWVVCVDTAGTFHHVDIEHVPPFRHGYVVMFHMSTTSPGEFVDE